MKMIPIGSKQIPFVRYDDQSSQMHIQYYTGQTVTCRGVAPDEVQLLMQSANPYDLIVKMAELKSLPIPEL